MATGDRSARWLLLAHLLPAKPSKLRVKTWRRLQGMGAVLIKNSVYVLPNSPDRREDFEWIRGEIVAQGGEAVVFVAAAVDDLADAEVVDAFVAARRNDWEELHRAAEALSLNSDGSGETEELGGLSREVRALRNRAAQIDKIDYFQAAGRREAIEALEAVGKKLTIKRAESHLPAKHKLADFRGRRWLTRPHPGVDRMASAWLIRRFVDPKAEFLYADRIPADGTLVPFDMFGVDFGHHGDECTFQTLLRSFDLDEPALVRIGRIVHDLDLPADTAVEPETATVGRLVEGLRRTLSGDEQLLESGMLLFEALYRSFRNDPGSH